MFNRYALGLLYSLAEYSLSRTHPLQETHTHTRILISAAKIHDSVYCLQVSSFPLLNTRVKQSHFPRQSASQSVLTRVSLLMSLMWTACWRLIMWLVVFHLITVYSISDVPAMQIGAPEVPFSWL